MQKWTCLNCKNTFNTYEVILPVHCSCGYIDKIGNIMEFEEQIKEPLCKLTRDKEIYRCEVCGWRTRIESAKHTCSGLRLPKKIVNVAKATWKFILSGFELSAQELISSRLVICKDCPLFIKKSDEPIEGICGHKGCGCHINESKFLNKLAWKSESCPDGKW